MYEKLIENYIQTLTESDIKNYIEKEGEMVTNQEVTTIYHFINKYYKQLLTDDGLATLQQIKPYLSIPLYSAIEKKYISTKNKFF